MPEMKTNIDKIVDEARGLAKSVENNPTDMDYHRASELIAALAHEVQKLSEKVAWMEAAAREAKP